MKLLFLVSAGGESMRRSLRAAVGVAAPDFELRMLAPDTEAKALRDCDVRTESWRPAGLFNVLRSINVLRRAVDRFEPDVIHAFGWTAAAVALGALPGRYARRTLVMLQDPIRKNEMPKAFIEKRLPELLGRAWSVECAYETLRRVLVDSLGIPSAKVRVVPYAVASPIASAPRRPVGRPGPIVGFAGRLDSDRAWEIAVDAAARVRTVLPDVRLCFGRQGPVAGLVRSHARTSGLGNALAFLDDGPIAELFGQIDLLVAPGTFDGLPYPVVEALIAGIPVIGADAGGIADAVAPWAGWLVPDDADGFSAGIREAWTEIDGAWRAAAEQSAAVAAVYDPVTRHAALRETYAHVAQTAANTPAPLGTG